MATIVFVHDFSISDFCSNCHSADDHSLCASLFSLRSSFFLHYIWAAQLPLELRPSHALLHDEWQTISICSWHMCCDDRTYAVAVNGIPMVKFYCILQFNAGEKPEENLFCNITLWLAAVGAAIVACLLCSYNLLSISAIEHGCPFAIRHSQNRHQYIVITLCAGFVAIAWHVLMWGQYTCVHYSNGSAAHRITDSILTFIAPHWIHQHRLIRVHERKSIRIFSCGIRFGFVWFSYGSHKYLRNYRGESIGSTSSSWPTHNATIIRSVSFNYN